MADDNNAGLVPGLDADGLEQVKASVRALCAAFPGEYCRRLDQERAYPAQFVTAMTEAGLLAILIPDAYGGSGLGLPVAATILEEVHACWASAAALHAQMYTMGTVLRHGSPERKAVAAEDRRRRGDAAGVRRDGPPAGSDTTSISTTATRRGDRYVINGQKVWTNRAERSDLMILLARTTQKDQVTRKTEGLSVFLPDMRKARGHGLTIKPIRTMFNHAATEVFIDDLEIPADCLIGEEGKGFRYILDGMNAERILIAAGCIGDARWFTEKAVD
jgi:alkylation response protein AidB-like acyl-CoA dehydrogenase